jgi:hypothetical protein
LPNDVAIGFTSQPHHDIEPYINTLFSVLIREAIAAVHNVGTCATFNRVGCNITDQQVNLFGTNYILDQINQVACNIIGIASIKLETNINARCLFKTLDDIDLFTTIKDVSTDTSDENIIIRAPVQAVVTTIAPQLIVAIATDKLIITTNDRTHVKASVTVNGIVTIFAM